METEVVEEEVVQPVAQTISPQAWPKVRFSQEDFSNVWQSLTQARSKVPGALPDTTLFAKSLADSIKYLNGFQGKPEGYISYQGLKDGTAPFLFDIKKVDDRGEGVRLSDKQIIALLAEDYEGNPFETGTNTLRDIGEALKRETPASAAASAAFRTTTYNTGRFLNRIGVMPNNWAGLGIRVGLPFLAGLTTSAIAYKQTQDVYDELFGKRGITLPGTQGAYEATRAALGNTAFSLFPYLVKKTTPIGSREWLANNLKDEEMAEAAILKTLPRSIRAGERLQSSLDKSLAYYKKHPLRAAFLEGTATTTTAAAAYQAEKADLGALGSLGLEAGAGITGSVAGDIALKRIPLLATLVKQGVVKLMKRMRPKDRGKEGVPEADLSDEDLTMVGRYVSSQLRLNDEDPEEIEKLLRSDEFQNLIDEAVRESGNEDLAKRAALQATEGGGYDVVTATRSPTLLGLLAQYKDQLNNELQTPELRKRANDSIEALRKAIVLLYSDGSKESLQDLAIIQTNLWEAEIVNQVAQAQDSVQKASKKLKADERTEAEKLLKSLEAVDNWSSGKEDRLWRKIQNNIIINEFQHSDGTVSEVPNFVRVWRQELAGMDTKVRKKFLNNDTMKFYDGIVEQESRRLGLAARPDDVLPEQKAFDKLVNDLEGTTEADELLAAIRRSDASDRSPFQKVQDLRQLADRLKTSEDKGPRTTQLAKAIDSYASLLNRKRKIQEEESRLLPEEAGGVSVKQLVNWRKVARTDAQNLSASSSGTQTNNNYARIVGKMRDAMLEDLDSLPIGVNADYDNARTFSAAKAEVFARGWAADLLGLTSSGKSRMSWQDVAKTIQRADGAFYRAVELDKASQFQFNSMLTKILSDADQKSGQELFDLALNEGVINPETRAIDMEALHNWAVRHEDKIDSIPGLRQDLQLMVGSMTNIRSAEQSLLQDARAKLTYDQQGEVTGGWSNLQAWMDDNDQLLNILPNLKAELTQALKTRTGLKKTIQETKALDKQRKQGITLYSLLEDKTFNPTVAMQKAISDNNPRPFSELNELYRVIEDLGEGGVTVIEKGINKGAKITKKEADEAFLQSLMDAIFEKGGGEASPVFNFRAAYDSLFTPAPNSAQKLSVADWIKSKDLMSEGRLSLIKKFIGEMAAVEAFVSRGYAKKGESLELDVDPKLLLLGRISGANMGQSISKMLGGNSSLIAGSAGSSAITTKLRALSDIPNEYRQDAIARVLNDRKLLSLALKKSRTKEEKESTLNEFLDSLIESFAINPAKRIIGPATRFYTEEEIKEEPRPGIEVPAFFSASLERSPAAPTGGASAPEPRPFVVAQLPVAQQPPAQTTSDSSGVASSPEMRARYKRDYPNDIVSSLIPDAPGQGIESLLG